ALDQRDRQLVSRNHQLAFLSDLHKASFHGPRLAPSLQHRRHGRHLLAVNAKGTWRPGRLLGLPSQRVAQNDKAPSSVRKRDFAGLALLSWTYGPVRRRPSLGTTVSSVIGVFALLRVV